VKLLDHTQILLIHPNVSNFTQDLNEVFNWPKFDEHCWNYQMIPVHRQCLFFYQKRKCSPKGSVYFAIRGEKEWQNNFSRGFFVDGKKDITSLTQM